MINHTIPRAVMINSELKVLIIGIISFILLRFIIKLINNRK